MLITIIIMRTIFDDEINHINKKNIKETVLIEHELNSGEIIEISVNSNLVYLENDFYKIDITFNQNTDIINYEVNDIVLKLTTSDDFEYICGYYSGNGKEYYVLEREDLKKQNLTCHFDNNYAHLQFIIKCDIKNDILLNIEYDINGKGIRTLNNFLNLKNECVIYIQE